MSRLATPLFGYSLHATDGEIGSLKDLPFDDEFRVVRYLVAGRAG